MWKAAGMVQKVFRVPVLDYTGGKLVRIFHTHVINIARNAEKHHRDGREF